MYIITLNPNPIQQRKQIAYPSSGNLCELYSHLDA